MATTKGPSWGVNTVSSTTTIPFPVFTTSALPLGSIKNPEVASVLFNPEIVNKLSRQDIQLLTEAATRPPRIKEDELSEDERLRLQVRRERNKLAAARCRDRRRDLTMTLQGETEELEDEKANLEFEVADLEKQKEQLELLLQVHAPLCKMSVADILNSNTTSTNDLSFTLASSSSLTTLTPTLTTPTLTLNTDSPLTTMAITPSTPDVFFPLDTLMSQFVDGPSQVADDNMNLPITTSSSNYMPL